MKTLRDKKAVAFFLLPALIVYTIMVMIPIAVSIYYSLIDWDGLGPKQFVGLSNFVKLLNDKIFIRSFTNNLLYIVIVMVLQLGFGFIIAVLLTYLVKGRGFIQTVYYIPSVITVIAIAQLFTSFYSAGSACASSSSTGVSLPNIETVTVTCCFSSLISLTTALLSLKGPSVMMMRSPTL